MSARQKLNLAAINGCLLIAGVAASLSESWLVFWVLLPLLITASLLTGSLRWP